MAENWKYHALGILLGGLVFLGAYLATARPTVSGSAAEESDLSQPMSFRLIDSHDGLGLARLSATKTLDPATDVFWGYTEQSVCSVPPAQSAKIAVNSLVVAAATLSPSEASWIKVNSVESTQEPLASLAEFCLSQPVENNRTLVLTDSVDFVRALSKIGVSPKKMALALGDFKLLPQQEN
jgi:hypothetical protein